MGRFHPHSDGTTHDHGHHDHHDHMTTMTTTTRA